MEIEIEQYVYRSKVREISCKVYFVDEYRVRWALHNFAVLVFRGCYKLEISDSNITIEVDSDSVIDPKNLEDTDWQLLKILHPEVKYFQWEVFQTLKDFVDNKIDEDYAMEHIKEILNKGE